MRRTGKGGIKMWGGISYRRRAGQLEEVRERKG